MQSNTLNPVWNELWNVKNVPGNALLKVEVMDKDEGSINDDYIGSFETTISQGSKEVEIVSTIFKKVKGTFWMKVSNIVRKTLNLTANRFQDLNNTV